MARVTKKFKGIKGRRPVFMCRPVIMVAGGISY